jgi:hypothetical protein
MFRAAHRSSSGALTVFAASGLHTHVVTGWSPHAYVNQNMWRVVNYNKASGSVSAGTICILERC